MYDVIIAGGGPAGLSAALMLGRCRRRVLLCDRGEPRNRHSRALHGYLTRDGIAPADFNELGRRELTPYGIECRPIGVARARCLDAGFDVTLDDGRTVQSRFLLLATGVVDELPDLPGIRECYGRSVFHCPYCDGWEWRDRRVAVVGRSGSSATKLALSLKTWSDDVMLCGNGVRIESRDRNRLRQHSVALRRGRIASIEHRDGLLERLTFADGSALLCDVLFFSTGQHQRDQLAAQLGCAFNERGTVTTGKLSATNVPRLFVAGDASFDAQFVIVAAAEGTKAAVAINQALQREGLKQAEDPGG